MTPQEEIAHLRRMLADSWQTPDDVKRYINRLRRKLAEAQDALAAIAAPPEVEWVDSSPSHVALVRRDNYLLRYQVRELARRIAVMSGSSEDSADTDERAESIARSALPKERL